MIVSAFTYSRGPSLDRVHLHTRVTPNGEHKTVIDLFHPDIALCVCVDCGKTWPEGASFEEGFPRECKR